MYNCTSAWYYISMEGGDVHVIMVWFAKKHDSNTAQGLAESVASRHPSIIKGIVPVQKQ